MPTSPVTTTLDALAQPDITILRWPSLLHPVLLRDDRVLASPTLCAPRSRLSLARVHHRR
ncbi:Os11g0203400 [Oryza sativa Japonica Group]|uniref:Os11g0203400 protein n=1 Tax=Oryza sativa subsp. japonica TaxID=39947 RepID=A0A0P0Y0S1_ORYSJ|nr:Os11g0203400 [Oryza sativa Japonica Group]